MRPTKCARSAGNPRLLPAAVKTCRHRSLRWRTANTAVGSGLLHKRRLPSALRFGKEPNRALHRQPRLLRRHDP